MTARFAFFDQLVSTERGFTKGVNHRPFNCFGMRVMGWRSQENYQARLQATVVA
jgi:hypothetical protein